MYLWHVRMGAFESKTLNFFDAVHEALDVMFLVMPVAFHDELIYLLVYYGNSAITNTYSSLCDE